MNKKALLIAIFIIAVMILPTFATVLAAPKEQLDFVLYIQGGTAKSQWLHDNGYLVGSPDNKWVAAVPLPPPEGCAVWNYINAPFVVKKVWLVIGGETIPYECLDYAATVSGPLNWLTKTSNFKIDETLTIYLTPADKAAKNAWGTLEMRTVSHSPYPPPTGVVVGTFEGHGTGALEGVKVQGTTRTEMIGTPPVSTKVREGTATGWP